MNVKNFVLSYYKNATSSMHVHKVRNSLEAQNPHTHDYFQIYFVTRGSVAHFTDNGSTVLLKGDMFIMPPKCMHYIDQSTNSEFFSFSFSPDSINRIYSENKLAVEFLSTLQNNGAPLNKVVLTQNEADFVENLLEQTLYEFEKKGLAYEEIMKCYLTVLLTVFARKHLEGAMPEIKISHHNREQIKYCIDYITKNYFEDFSLSEMAHHSALSKSVFCKAFKEQSGYTFNEFINRARINAVKNYIRKGYKISAVYGVCGYKDFSTFYRNFKKIVGVSPEEYKKQV
ncbi:MAG: helix-turn-helix domain-containing protein [Clostridia bacterium]|nr:helix-turn-helix domain-containing protein [Clostridia bacterium]